MKSRKHYKRAKREAGQTFSSSDPRQLFRSLYKQSQKLKGSTLRLKQGDNNEQKK